MMNSAEGAMEIALTYSVFVCVLSLLFIIISGFLYMLEMDTEKAKHQIVYAFLLLIGSGTLMMVVSVIKEMDYQEWGLSESDVVVIANMLVIALTAFVMTGLIMFFGKRTQKNEVAEKELADLTVDHPVSEKEREVNGASLPLHDEVGLRYQQVLNVLERLTDSSHRLDVESRYKVEESIQQDAEALYRSYMEIEDEQKQHYKNQVLTSFDGILEELNGIEKEAIINEAKALEKILLLTKMKYTKYPKVSKVKESKGK